MDSPMSSGQRVLLLAAVVVGLLVRLEFFTGAIASDELTHAWAAAHFLDGPDETLVSHGDGHSGFGVNGRRVGMNLPLFLVTKVAGISERTLASVPLAFSLMGIVLAFLAARQMAGVRAGLLAAWLWALLPADVYTATLWMQDNAFATLLMGLMALVATIEKRGKDDWAATGYAALAGAVAGYMGYLKETGVLMLLPLGLWALWRSIAARRLGKVLPAIVGGFVAVQILAMAYFAAAFGDPLHFYKATIQRYSVFAGDDAVPKRFPANLFIAGKYLGVDLVFGFAVVLVPVFVWIALRDGRWTRRHRVYIGLVLILQCLLFQQALTAGSWTQRYTLQISAPVVLLTALAVDGAVAKLATGQWLARFSERWRRQVAWAAMLGIMLLTGGALSHQRQQHGRQRAREIREAFAFVAREARPDDPIYIGRPAGYYTMRTFAFFAGYQDFKGGLRMLDEVRKASSGWAVIGNLEDSKGLPRLNWPDYQPLADPPPNWRLAFESKNRRATQWVRVYRITSVKG